MTNIEWTEKTWNPVVGCSKVSPGCKNFYAERMAHRLREMALADVAAGRNPGRKQHYIDAVSENGRWTGKLVPVPEALVDPLGWRKPSMVFVNSMSDLFHEALDVSFIACVFGVMAYARRHTFQVLTKWPRRMARIMSMLTLEECLNAAGLAPDFEPAWPPENVWLGVSIENRKQTERINVLLRTKAAVRFISAEPLLERTDLGLRSWAEIGNRRDDCRINWVIVGGESGAGARPCELGWIRDVVRDCRLGGVPCFVKQLGSRPRYHEIQSAAQWMRSRGIAGPALEIEGTVEMEGDWPISDAKGGDPAEWPEDLRVREWPKKAGAAV